MSTTLCPENVTTFSRYKSVIPGRPTWIDFDNFWHNCYPESR